MASRYIGANQRPVIVRRARTPPRRVHQINQQWKIAYADFATAMMAFFMLLWLMSHSEKVSLQGVADYFAPSNATMSNSSGAGSILSGAALGPDGAKSSGAYNPDTLSAIPAHRDALGYGTTSARDRHENSRRGASDRRADRLRTVLTRAPVLAAAHDRLIVTADPDGTRIELTDSADRSLFDVGDAQPNAYGRQLLQTLAAELMGERQRIAIAAHTDATGADAANWELSARRALAARVIMAAAGLTPDRFAEVTGMAASDPLYPIQPNRPENRRLSLVLLDEAPAAPGRLASPTGPMAPGAR